MLYLISAGDIPRSRLLDRNRLAINQAHSGSVRCVCHDSGQRDKYLEKVSMPRILATGVMRAVLSNDAKVTGLAEAKGDDCDVTTASVDSLASDLEF
jgi:hypothetical protein